MVNTLKHKKLDWQFVPTWSWLTAKKGLVSCNDMVASCCPKAVGPVAAENLRYRGSDPEACAMWKMNHWYHWLSIVSRPRGSGEILWCRYLGFSNELNWMARLLFFMAHRHEGLCWFIWSCQLLFKIPRFHNSIPLCLFVPNSNILLGGAAEARNIVTTMVLVCQNLTSWNMTLQLLWYYDIYIYIYAWYSYGWKYLYSI